MDKVFYHVSSSLPKNNCLLFDHKKPLQSYIDHLLQYSIDSYNDYNQTFVSMEKDYIDIKKYTWRDEFKWMAELLFEQARKRMFSDLPSRMNGVFLTSDINEARRFNKLERGGKANIYMWFLPPDGVYSFNMSIFTKVYRELLDHKLKNINYYQYRALNLNIKSYWLESNYDGNEAEYLTELYPIKLSFVE